MASATGGNERVEINTSVGVRGDNGMFFGNMLWLESKRMLIEIATDLAPNENVDLRITLVPTNATALMTGRVERRLVTAGGEVPRYLINILSVSRDDQERLQAWMDNVRGRGTFANFDLISAPAPASKSSSGEVQQALEQLSRRPLSVPSVTTDPFGVRSDVSDAQGGGRGGVRDALREALQRRGGSPGRLVAGIEADNRSAVGRPDRSLPGRVVATGADTSGSTGSVPPRSGAGAPPASAVRSGVGRVDNVFPSAASNRSDSVFPRSDVSRGGSASPPSGAGRVDSVYRRSENPVSDANASRPGIARAAAPTSTGGSQADPSYSTMNAQGETWMEVRWRSAATFERDARLQLFNRMLVVARGATPLPDGAVRLMVRHADFALDCRARLGASGAHGATWQLELDALQQERLKQWLKTYAAARG